MGLIDLAKLKAVIAEVDGGEAREIAESKAFDGLGGLEVAPSDAETKGTDMAAQGINVEVNHGLFSSKKWLVSV